MKKLLILLTASVLAFACFAGCDSGSGNGQGGNGENPDLTKFVTVYEGTESKTLSSSGSVTFEFEKELTQENYININFDASVNVRGEILYTVSGSEASEEFFSLAGSNISFRQILDYYGYNYGNKKLTGIKFYNLSETDGAVKVSSVAVAKHPINFFGINFFDKEIEPQLQLFLTGKTIKFGCTLKSGGAVNWLSSIDGTVGSWLGDGNEVIVGKKSEMGNGGLLKENDVNLINTYDNGRLVQQSYYGAKSGTGGYEGGTYNDKVWAYNPVQGGDQYNNCSQLVDVQVSDTEIYVKTRALDWAMNDSVTPSYMENRFILRTHPEYGEYVEVQNTFTDFSGYAHNNVRHQELPAFYGIAPLGRAVYYAGDRPFTGDTLTAVNDLSWWGDSQEGNRFVNKENWFGFFNKDDFGIGLYVPDVSAILAGRTEGFTADYDVVGTDPYKAPPTTYAAPLCSFSMRSYESFSYNYYLTIGSAGESRGLFYSLKQSGATNAYLVGKEPTPWI